jgi:hypothetical protein
MAAIRYVGGILRELAEDADSLGFKPAIRWYLRLDTRRRRFGGDSINR